MESNNCEAPNPGSSQAKDSRMSPRTINPESNYEVIDLSSSPPPGLRSDDSECKDNEDLPSTWLNPVSYVTIL